MLASQPARRLPLINQPTRASRAAWFWRAGPGTNGGGTFTKSGGGTLELDGPPSLGNNSSVNISGGTLRLNVTPASSGSGSVGTGVTATVTNQATLELAGSVSALASGTHRVGIINNSTAAAGVLVSGTNQIVGNIDGSGTTQVNAGSDLTASHIVESALVIGGTANSKATVTISASDAAGNPLDDVGRRRRWLILHQFRSTQWPIRGQYKQLDEHVEYCGHGRVAHDEFIDEHRFVAQPARAMALPQPQCPSLRVYCWRSSASSAAA